MSQDLKLNSNHDLDFSGGDLQLVAGSDESAQSILIRLHAYYGEWFLDTSLGTPHYQKVLGIPFRPYEQAAVYRRRILQTQGVMSVESFDFSRINRELSIEARVRLDDGSTTSIVVAA